LRHVAKDKLTLLVLIVITGGVCQKSPAPAQSVATPRSQVTASSAVLPTLAGRDFYVAATGSSAGDGSLDNPWDLQTALYQPSAVHPGDTIWLRGGTYAGKFISSLTGTPSAPIKVRQYPGERAIIDGACCTSTYTLTFNQYGSYTWFWGLEVTNSNTTRTNPIAGSNVPNERALGINVSAVGIKLINMVIHDTGQGIFMAGNVTSEAYGNLIYYNGWSAPDRGHGHAIYVQNVLPATKTIKDNIMFAQFGFGLHAYTEDGTLDKIYAEGNTSFIEGVLAGYYTYNMLYGGLTVANNPSLISNYTYTPISAGGNNLLGYVGGGCTNATVTGNYFVGNTALKLVNCATGLSMTSNTFYGDLSGFTSSQYPSNTYYSSRPTATQVFVRPNQYESGRANITVFNWARSAAVSVDLGELLDEGDEFVVRNAQDFFGPPVVSATYSEGSVEIPMEGLAVAQPIGHPSPPSVAPDFGAFVVELLRPARSRADRIPPSRPPATLIPRRP
jgi:hypothetical protein